MVMQFSLTSIPLEIMDSCNRIPGVVPFYVDRPPCDWLKDIHLDLSRLYNQPYASDITLHHTLSGRTWHLHSDVILAVLQTVFDESTLNTLSSSPLNGEYLDWFFQYIYGKWDGDIDDDDDNDMMQHLMRIVHVFYIAHVCGVDTQDAFTTTLIDTMKCIIFDDEEDDDDWVVKPSNLTQVLRCVNDFVNVMDTRPKWVDEVISVLIEGLATLNALEHDGVVQSLKLDGKIPDVTFKVRTKKRRANVTISLLNTTTHDPQPDHRPPIVFNYHEMDPPGELDHHNHRLDWSVVLRKYVSGNSTYMYCYGHHHSTRIGLYIYGHVALQGNNPLGHFSKRLEAAATLATVQTKYAHLLPRPNFIVTTTTSKMYFWVHDWLLYAKWPYFANVASVRECEEMKTRKLVLNDVPEAVLRYFLQRLYEGCEPRSEMERELQSWAEYEFVPNV